MRTVLQLLHHTVGLHGRHRSRTLGLEGKIRWVALPGLRASLVEKLRLRWLFVDIYMYT